MTSQTEVTIVDVKISYVVSFDIGEKGVQNMVFLVYLKLPDTAVNHKKGLMVFYQRHLTFLHFGL